ncbi:MAG: hypothetical protein ABI461_11585, partial [Polyangiaceae bacterium]
MRRRLAFCCVAILVACGSRTALVGDEDQTIASSDDAGEHDASIDAGRDAELRLDGAPDVFRNDCPDPSTTFIYLISQTRELYSFNPVTNAFHDIGLVDCPTTDGEVFSMAVDRAGTAYVLFYDGNTPATGSLWRVSTANAACKAIPEYVAGQHGFNAYGMGFATNAGGPSETLYLEGAEYFGSSGGLATLDTTTFELDALGSNNPEIQGGELTGTGDGRLFSFFFYGDESVMFLGQLDKTNGRLLTQKQLNSLPNSGG